MPRRGWIFDEDLSQVLWRQLLRGPRPPSVQWPRRNVSAVDGQRPAKKGKGKGQAKGAGKDVGKGAGRAKGQTDVQSRRGVGEPSPEGRERVVRLQAALDAMGNADDPEVQSLREALRKAKQAVSPGPVGERLDRCAQFIGRAEKRLQKADEALEKLQADRTILVRELAEGRARLEALRVEASQEMARPAQPVGDPVGTEDVQRLRELVEKLRSQVSSLEAGKEDQWRGAEELWELRQENEQLRKFRDEHPDSASAHQPRAAKCDSTEEADGKRRRVLAIAEGAATGSTFA